MHEGRSGAWAFAAVAVASLLTLPIGRPGRALLELDPGFNIWNLGVVPLWVAPAAAIAATAVAFLPLQKYVRGEFLTAFGAAGLLTVVGWLIVTATPFGIGAVIALAALVIVTGYGLSESGRIQGDAFVASSVLFVGLFIVLMILYPLLTVLRTSVIVDGQFTLQKVRETLGGPRFLMLQNVYSPRNELGWIGGFGAAGVVLGAAWAAVRRLRWPRALRRIALVGIIGLSLGIMVFGRGAMVTSVLLAIIVATSATLLGLAFALLGQRTRVGPIRRSLNAVSLLPIITPPFILAFSMIFLFGRRGMFTHDVLGLSTNFIFGIPGVAIAQVLAFTPIAYLVIQGSVSGLDASLEEASTTLGAGRWTLFRTITWPLLRPGLANAFLLSTIESFADFGNPIILGGDRRYLATEVFSAFSARFDPSEAAVYGVVLLFIVLLVFAAQARWLGRSSFVTVTGKPSQGRFVALPRALEAVLVALFVAWSLVVLALYASILYGSVVKLWGVDSTLTFQHYRDLLNTGWPTFLYTVRVAVFSAIPAALLGFLIAYLVVRQRFWGRRYMELGSMLSFSTPGTVMGIAYILAFNTGPWLLTTTTVILVLALIFRNMPVAIRGGVAGLAQVDPSLEEASTTLGASSSTTLRRILLPLLIFPLLGGLIFGFVRGMTAISQIIFLVGPGNMLVTVLLLGWVEQGQNGRAAAMGSLLIVSMLTVILLLMLLSRMRGVRTTEVMP